MIYATVCSGIDAPAVAWKPLGWTQAFSSDIEPFPNAVRAHHDPDVPNYGDMTDYKNWPDHDLGLICAGTPCQAFSVAGLRKGLDDPRGNLTLVFLGILERYRPEWVVWENVPGVLSIDGGRVFGAFLGGLGQLGYGFAYRVLDAQHFGVPQRRRRVFVVGHLGDWRRAAAVLFERHSLQGHPAPRREAGQSVANCLTDRADRGGTNSEGQRLIPQLAPTMRAGGNRTGGDRPPGTDVDTCDSLIPQVANPLTARMGKGINTTADEGQTPIVTHSLRAEGFDASEDGTGRGTPLAPVAFSTNGDGGGSAVDIAPCLDTRAEDGPRRNQGGAIIQTAMQVRRLTPRECERLQGFPDDYTLITVRGKPAADGPRYKALGNSMAVPVMRWIGERIQMVEDLVL